MIDDDETRVYLSDGETWDTTGGCRVVFYDNDVEVHSVPLDRLIGMYLSQMEAAAERKGQ